VPVCDGLTLQPVEASLSDFTGRGAAARAGSSLMARGSRRADRISWRTDTQWTGFPSAAGPAVWFDADNNGFPELLLSRKQANDATGRLWDTGLLRNLGNDNHWLQLKLRGPRRNREAIGAHVIVTAGGRALRQQVGQFEGSSCSQGHYRLYFGLGAADRVDRIEVLWPDGTRTIRSDVAPNRLLTIAKDSG
jgi:hypothetical protein